MAVIGRIRITPADVGRRVSVRSRLTDHGAGRQPGATDALGTLLAWPVPGSLVIARDRHGDTVTIAAELVLAAKVVPPDTAVMTWQEHADTAWGCTGRAEFGDWLAHWQPGEDVRDRGIRAGSDPRVPARIAIEHLLPQLGEHATVTGPVLRAPLPSVHDPDLRALGWRPGRTILFLTRSLAPAASVPVGRHGRPASASPHQDHASTLTADAGSLRITRVADAALMTGLRVDKGARRQGIGRALTQQACTWAGERRLRQIGLQVLADNEAACALYASLGFTVHHRYHYWHPPAPQSTASPGVASRP